VAIWEITSDVGVPAFLCMVAESRANPAHATPPVGGEGCHPCRDIALLRALTEAAQKRLTMITGSRDDLGYAEYARRFDAHYIEAMTQVVRATDGERSFHSAPTRNFDSCEQDVSWELQRLGERGLEQVIAVELASLPCGVHVVRVVIPGLEAIQDIPGYVPGARARAQKASFA
jgi:ribosomal protein S12 methylthiotransferase accessory factor